MRYSAQQSSKSEDRCLGEQSYTRGREKAETGGETFRVCATKERALEKKLGVRDTRSAERRSQESEKPGLFGREMGSMDGWDCKRSHVKTQCPEL